MPRINNGMDDTIRTAITDYQKYLTAIDRYCILREHGFDYWTSLYEAAEDVSPSTLSKLIAEKAKNGEIDDEEAESPPKKKKGKFDEFDDKGDDMLFVKKKKKGPPNHPEFDKDGKDRDLDDNGRDDETNELVTDQDGVDARKKPIFSKDETGMDGDEPKRPNDPIGKNGELKKEPVVKEREPKSKDADKVPLGKTVVIINPKETEDEAGKVYENFKKTVSLNMIRSRRVK